MHMLNDLYASSCVLSRLDAMIQGGSGEGLATSLPGEAEAGKYFLSLANRRIEDRFAALADNDDAETVRAADAALARW